MAAQWVPAGCQAARAHRTVQERQYRVCDTLKSLQQLGRSYEELTCMQLLAKVGEVSCPLQTSVMDTISQGTPQTSTQAYASIKLLMQASNCFVNLCMRAVRPECDTCTPGGSDRSCQWSPIRKIAERCAVLTTYMTSCADGTYTPMPHCAVRNASLPAADL